MENLNHLSLSQLNGMIREAIEMNFLDEVWLVAEIAELRVAGAGHCYLDLVEKKNNRIVARVRANIWKFQYDRITKSFFAATGGTLQKGMKVLLVVSVSFHEQYGVSLVVKNIDPNYSLGDLERKKKEIIKRLTQENLIKKNGLIDIELVPKRIAVISSDSAAGYGDFMNQLHNNSGGYLFETKLFNSTMQGEAVEYSIIKSLGEIASGIYDCVVIIRGGGASLDLAGFDNYNLGIAIANFNIPVLTGIGHERDETITDLVAHSKLKTPTAVAEFLIEKMQNFEEYYTGLREALVYFSRENISQKKAALRNLSHVAKTGTQKGLERNRIKLTKINSELPLVLSSFLKSKKQSLNNCVQGISSSKSNLINDQNQKIVQIVATLKLTTKQALRKQNSDLKLIEKTIKLIHPDNVIKRGYTMLIKDGNVLTSVDELKKGDEVEIKLRDGIKKSKIIE